MKKASPHLSFKLIDSTHFEIEIQLEKFSKNAELSLYMFLPHQTGLDSYTYPKELFYRNLMSEQSYVFGEAELDNLAEQLILLREFVHLDSKKNHKQYWSQLSLFNLQWQKAFKTRAKDINESQSLPLVLRTLTQVKQLLAHFRQTKPHDSQIKANKSFKYLDNYLSWFTKQQLLKLSSDLKLGDASVQAQWKNELFDLVEQETQYAEEQSFRSYQADEDGADRLLGKMNQLLRYLKAPIQLQSERKPVGIITEQMVFGLAAATSMAIATAIAFYFQRQFGNFSTPFFYALVLSYILKDRFKELSRGFIYGFLSRKFFSFSYSVRDPDNKKKIALIKDTCRFIHKESLPHSVEILRTKHRFVNYEIEEKQIMFYKRRIQVFPNAFSPTQRKISDSLVFNLSRMLRNLPNNKKSLFFRDEGKTKTIIGRQRYSINLCLVMTSQSREEIKYFRLVINKKGVIEVEDSTTL